MLRRLRGRFGISAPQVAVRTHLPWYLRVLAVVVLVALSVTLTGWAYDAGRRIAGFDRSETDQVLTELRSANAALDEEVAKLRAALTASESSLKIEQASQQLLSDKNAELAAENARIKEELAVFERLAKLEKKPDSGVMLDRLKVEREAAAGQYRYSFLIALQGPRRGKDSKLQLQIVASPREGGRGGDKIVLPRKDDPNLAQYEIELKNFRRIEGRFELPTNVSYAAFEFKILEDGMVRASQSLNI